MTSVQLDWLVWCVVGLAGLQFDLLVCSGTGWCVVGLAGVQLNWLVCSWTCWCVVGLTCVQWDWLVCSCIGWCVVGLARCIGTVWFSIADLDHQQDQDRAASDILGDAEDSEDAYLCIMMEEAGVLLCSLTGMVKIHQSDRCLKVHVPRP